MSIALGNAAKLREMLLQYEVSLGLTGLTSFERDVLFAFRLVADQSESVDVASSEDVKKYHSIKEMAHATYHRSVKGLVLKGFLKSESYGQYIIISRSDMVA